MNTWHRWGLILFLFLTLGISAAAEDNCSSFLVTRGASQDGSVMITYTCDGEFHPRLEVYSCRRPQLRGMFKFPFTGRDAMSVEKSNNPLTPMPSWVSMNEHQLAIGETTFGGRQELRNPRGLLHYFLLMRLALQRAKTAREAIEVMGNSSMNTATEHRGILLHRRYKKKHGSWK